MRIVTFATVLLVLAARNADACTCGWPRSACSAIGRVSALFSGTVTEIASLPGPPSTLRAIRFRIDRRGKGTDGREAVVYAPLSTGANCGITFQVGQLYIVYGYSGDGGRLTTDMCAGTKLASEGPRDLQFLTDLEGPPRGVRVQGLVYRRENERLQRPSGAGMFGNGVAGARVRVTGMGVSREVVTKGDGRYDLRDLPAGTYRVELTPPRGLAEPGAPLPPSERGRIGPYVVSASLPFGCAEEYFQLRNDSRITGSLRDPRGRPAGDKTVDLVPLSRVGAGARVNHVSVRTDSRGDFVFAFVPPGQYVLGVGIASVPGPLELDRRLYHPGVSEASRASVVNIGEGGHVRLAPFMLRAAPATRTISGRVVFADGTDAPAADVTLWGPATERVQLDADARFRLVLPYGTRYELSAHARPERGSVARPISPTVTIDRNDRDRELTLVLRISR